MPGRESRFRATALLSWRIFSGVSPEKILQSWTPLEPAPDDASGATTSAVSSRSSRTPASRAVSAGVHRAPRANVLATKPLERNREPTCKACGERLGQLRERTIVRDMDPGVSEESARVHDAMRRAERDEVLAANARGDVGSLPIVRRTARSGGVTSGALARASRSSTR